MPLLIIMHFTVCLLQWCLWYEAVRVPMPADRVKAVGPKVAALLGGRGGGRPGRYQGKATAIEKAAQALTLLKEAALSECQSI